MEQRCKTWALAMARSRDFKISDIALPLPHISGLQTLYIFIDLTLAIHLTGTQRDMKWQKGGAASSHTSALSGIKSNGMALHSSCTASMRWTRIG